MRKPYREETAAKCKHCGQPNYDSKGRHVHYGNDLDNPVKHEFEPSELSAAKPKRRNE